MGRVDFQDNWELGPAANTIGRAGIVIGVLGVAAAAALGFFTGDNSDRFFQSYLINFCFYLSLALGGLFFVLIQHLTGATWSVVVRRIAETISGNLWLMAILFIPIAVSLPRLYEWAHPEVVANDPILQAKEAFLNPAFFWIRSVVYFLVWILLSTYFQRKSLSQDETGDIPTTLSMERVSAPGTILFALTTTFASFDYLMSLDPHWFSTIFGVYFFSGCMFAFFALLPLIVNLLQRNHRLARTITPEHFHDMGKWMLTFVVFWAYIGFSQYMLIWYANLPEETVWYAARQQPGWVPFSIIILVGHFIIPFFGLLPRWVKKTSNVLVLWSIYMLLMHWIDLFWLVMPQFTATPKLHLIDVALWVGMGGLFFGLAALRVRNHSLVPAGDPRLRDSLAFENI